MAFPNLTLEKAAPVEAIGEEKRLKGKARIREGCGSLRFELHL